MGLTRTSYRALCAVVTLTLACSPTSGGNPEPPRRPVPEAVRIAFEDATRHLAVRNSPQRTWGAAWVDHDSNGFPDLFVVRHWGDPLFLANHGGGYDKLEVGAFVGRRFDRHGCAWGEANGDGAPDLYCVQGADKGTGAGANGLWLNEGDAFTDVATETGVADRLGRGRSANWLDHDGDGDLDLYVANHKRAEAGNRLFRNTGGSFTAVAAGVEENLASVSSSWADWDRDGDPDLLVLRYGRPPVAYENRGGRFRRAALEGLPRRAWQSAAWGDANGDRWADLHLVSPRRAVVLANRRGRFVAMHEMDLDRGRTSAWLDVENDGDMDLYVVRGARGKNYRPTTSSRDAKDVLLLNEDGTFRARRLPRPPGTATGNGDSVTVADGDRDGFADVFLTHGHLYWRGRSVLLANRSRGGTWAGIDLAGPAANPLAIGAEVKVVAGALSYVRAQTDGVTFRSQSEVGYVSLGLGTASSADVEVRWPGGDRDCVTVEAGDIVEVAPGDAPCRPPRGRRGARG